MQPTNQKADNEAKTWRMLYCAPALRVMSPLLISSAFLVNVNMPLAIPRHSLRNITVNKINIDSQIQYI